MRKYAYLARLEELLAALPAQERQDALNYYEEYFDAAGSENEEKTAEELGDPAEVARKVLEGEGIDLQEESAGENPQPAQNEAVKETPPEEPAPFPVPPEGPEPPRLEDPEHYPNRGIPSEKDAPQKKRLWLIFWLLVALALVIQISVLLLGIGGHSGTGTSMAASSVDYAESSSMASEEEPLPTAVATANLDAEGAVTYSGTLEVPQKGTLFVVMTRGNVAFRTGDQATVEVRNVDVNNKVSYGRTVDYGYTFTCDSVDPDTHVTITLPPDAYDRIEISVTNSGAIDLGDLQIRSISAYTASGPIQSGQVRTETLEATTDIGNIWLEKVSDGTKYQVKTVDLSAPSGSVAASFSASRNQWKTDITAPEGMTESTGKKEESQIDSRTLQVVSARTVTLQYGIR